MKSKKVNKPNKTNKKREEIIMFEIDSWIIEMEKIYFGVDLYEHITKQSSIKQLEAK